MAKTKILKVDQENPEPDIMLEAAGILKNGGLVAFPTETVYGLAAVFNNRTAVQKLYEVKARPGDKPLTVHISSLEMMDGFNCEVSRIARKLMIKFWPGPLTLIFKKNGCEDTVGFRFPDNRICSALITACGAPVLAPSANMSGKPSPRTAEDVAEGLDGKIDLILDGGRTRFGMDSTIIDVSVFPCRVLREGAIPNSAVPDAWYVEEPV